MKINSEIQSVFQYSDKFCIDMVSIVLKNNLSDGSSTDQEMSTVVTCPVCDSQLTLQTISQVLAGGQQTDYCSISGYYKHIRNVHLQPQTEKKSSKVNTAESSTSTIPRKKSKENVTSVASIKRKPKRRRQAQREEESETSSDSEIENEIYENVQIESDMDMDMDMDENSQIQNRQSNETEMKQSKSNDRRGKICIFSNHSL